MQVLFVGVDGAERHHDICLLDDQGSVLAKRRIPDGLTGVTELHALLACHTEDPTQVVVGIETDRGLLVGALLGAGYQVYGINPLAVSRYRNRHSVSGAKSDRGDAKVLADLVRTVLSLAPTPAAGARWLTPRSRVRCGRLAARFACRRGRPRSVRRCAPQLDAPALVAEAYGQVVTATVAVLCALNQQLAALEEELAAALARHPQAGVLLSQPGLGVVLATRVLVSCVRNWLDKLGLAVCQGQEGQRPSCN